MKKNFLFLLAITGCMLVTGQTKYDTIVNLITENPVVIDGQASEACWENASWVAIDQVWIPWGETMTQGDFEGRFKVSWDENYLYMLVEVQDDSLSDDYDNPLDNWWNDDCLEIFIDEDRSMGNHERNNNAFAYHVSLSYDAIDLNSSGGPINYRDHIEVEMDTIGENLYLWELAIKIYDETYDHLQPEESRITLSHDKLMGLSVAYCDNDETTARENFIGSMEIPQANYNDSYKNADFFGVMRLEDPGFVGIEAAAITPKTLIYPNPAKEEVFLELPDSEGAEVRLIGMDGKVLGEYTLTDRQSSLQIHDIPSGQVIIRISTSTGVEFHKILVK